MSKQDKDLMEDNDELLDDEMEIEEANNETDPGPDEKASIASVAKAGDTGPKAKKRKGDKDNGEKKAPKSKSGIVRELYDIMSEMAVEDLDKLRAVLMDEDVDLDDDNNEDLDAALEDVDYDFTTDLNALVESEATLSEEFKEKTAVIFEAAIKSKLTEEINRIQAEYDDRLNEELEANLEEMTDKLDRYLTNIAEEWMEENRLAVEAGLRTEIAEDFMKGLQNLFAESYIQVPEEKVDLVDSLAEEVEALTDELNAKTDKMMDISEELEGYKRESIIREASDGLAETQVDKLRDLVESLDFDNEETFRNKVETVKESYFTKSHNNETILDDETDDEETTYEVSASMSRYVEALKKTKK